MAFTIPNNSSAGAYGPADSRWQSRLDSTDISIMISGSNGNGVLSGCAVTAQGSPNMTVAVASGTIVIAGDQITVSANASLAIGTADGTNPRKDIVVIGNTGTISVTAGTAAADPVKPAIPANSIVIAEVLIPASDTTIGSDQIIDKRVILDGTQPIFDTAANMTSANPVLVAGQIGYTDTDILGVGDGSTAWNSLPKIYPFSDPVILTSTTTVSGVGATTTDITGLTGLTFTVGAQPWIVELYCPYVTSSAADHTAMLFITNSSDTTQQQAPVFTGSASVSQGIVRWIVTSSGTYTNYKARINRASGAGTVGVGAALASLEASLIARPL